MESAPWEGKKGGKKGFESEGESRKKSSWERRGLSKSAAPYAAQKGKEGNNASLLREMGKGKNENKKGRDQGKSSSSHLILV